MKKWIMIIALILIALVCSAKTYKVEIAFPENSSSNTTLVQEANSIISKLDKMYSSTDIDFELVKTTRGENIKMNNNVETVWKRNMFINSSGADLTIIVTGKHTGSLLGMATVGHMGERGAVAVVSSSDEVLLAHEVGHLFGLRHVDGAYIMNGKVTGPHYTFCKENLILLKSFDYNYKPLVALNSLYLYTIKYP